MSQGRKIPDIERTATMLDLVRERYYGSNGGAPAYVVIEEVAPGTGFANRWADCLALSCWRSNGLTLDGYEIKASKGDLKRELADLSKHTAVARYCDTWTLVVWDESLLVDGIPADWGIMVTVDAGYELRELKVHRKPTKRAPEPWPRDFICSLVRNASQQSVGAAFVARACAEARKRAWDEGQRGTALATRKALGPLAIALWGKDSHRWPAEAHDPEKLILLAAKRLSQGELSPVP